MLQRCPAYTQQCLETDGPLRRLEALSIPERAAPVCSASVLYVSSLGFHSKRRLQSRLPNKGIYTSLAYTAAYLRLPSTGKLRNFLIGDNHLCLKTHQGPRKAPVEEEVQAGNYHDAIMSAMGIAHDIREKPLRDKADLAWLEKQRLADMAMHAVPRYRAKDQIATPSDLRARSPHPYIYSDNHLSRTAFPPFERPTTSKASKQEEWSCIGCASHPLLALC